MVATGLIFGFLLGFILQRWQFNFAHELQAGLTNWRSAGLLNILVIILVESIILFLLILSRVVTLPAIPDYAPWAVIVGSLLFGWGMQLAGGCIIDSLVRLGTLDLNSLLTLVVFIFTLVFYNRGSFSKVLDPLTTNQVSDQLLRHPHATFYIPLTVLFIITGAWLIWYLTTKQTRRSVVIAALVGLLAGGSYLANARAGSFGSFAIVSPLLSWYGYIKGKGAGIDISWGMYFIVSTIIGSLVAALWQRKLFQQPITLWGLCRALLGGILMGIGAGLSKGTFISNGVVYTAMFSIQGWLALLFIIVGLGSMAGLTAIFKKH
ncbi:YeeE/YedE family protein [Limosilactobacillus sp.]|uniref:YeeE/YedE family protein n=1 Tax=Limosilactobacillus sp. TaxID=2773925 RepID=UPI003F10A27F